jgi:hypothetical protein
MPGNNSILTALKKLCTILALQMFIVWLMKTKDLKLFQYAPVNMVLLSLKEVRDLIFLNSQGGIGLG